MRIQPRTKHQSAFGYSPKLAITIQFGLFSLKTMKRKADSKEKPKLSFSILYLLMLMMPLHHQQWEEGTEHNQWIWLTHIGKGIHFALLFAEKSLSLFLFIPHIFIWFPRCLRKKNTLNSLFFLLFLFLFLFSLVCVVVHRYRIVSAPAFGLHLKNNLFLLWKPFGNGMLCPHYKTIG